jgi:hypothetical protein
LESETPPNFNVLFPVVFENEASTPLLELIAQRSEEIINIKELALVHSH